MKKILQGFCFLLLSFFIISGMAFAGNKEWCQEWCSQHSGICKKCSDLAGCGVGYNAIVTFKDKGKNWHACEGLERNKEACEAWCGEHKPRCVKCSEHIGCGTGLKRIMSFTGPGKNWHACEKTDFREASEGNKAECEAWCAANPPCEKCSTLVGCGPGYKAMKHFTGRGKNYHACKKR